MAQRPNLMKAKPVLAEDEATSSNSSGPLTILTQHAARRSGLIATAASVTISMIASAATLGLTAVISARALGPSGRGAFVISLTLGTFLMLLGGCGAGLGGRRSLATESGTEHCSLQEYNNLKRRLVLVHVVIATIGGFLILPALAARDSTGQQVAFVAYAVLVLGAALSRDALYGVGASRQAAGVNAASSGLLLGGVIVLTFVGRSSVATYLWAFAGSALVEFVAASALAKRRAGEHVSTSRPGQMTRLLRSGSPALVLIVAQTAVLRGDRLIIGAMATTRDVGLYAAAATATELMAVGAFAVAQVLFQPVASGTVEPSAVRRLRTLALLVTAATSLALFVLAPWVIETVFGPPFEAAVPLLRVLAIAVLPYASYQMDIYYLAAIGRAGTAARVSLAGVVTLVAADLVLISIFGVTGAPYACLSAYVVIAILARTCARQDHGEPSHRLA